MSDRESIKEMNTSSSNEVSNNQDSETIRNRFQESCDFYTPQQSFDEQQTLVRASEQLKEHLSGNYGFSSFEEYNTHILPPHFKTEQDNVIAQDDPCPSNNMNLPSTSKSSNPIMDSPSSLETQLPVNDDNISSENLSTLILQYSPVKCHWFYCKYANKNIWVPFSQKDSNALEQQYLSEGCDEKVIIPTNGSRFDVHLTQRIRKPAYWTDESTVVRRSSWFFRSRSGSNYIPYDEQIATLLEENYKAAWDSNEWGRRVPVGNFEEVVMHSPTAIIHCGVSVVPFNTGDETQPESQVDQLINVPSIKQCIVKRGLDEFIIPVDEPSKVDNLMFIVHGIGPYCDFKMRPIYEVVDDFRSLALQLTQSHFKTACSCETIGRIEVLPISWHLALHSESIDRKIKSVTLPSIPKLRDFSNDTILDVLFYTSPTFCQTIVNAVGNEMNRMYSQYRIRNPDFNGHVSIGGHSLGSLISFDLLCNQRSPNSVKQSTSNDPTLDPTVEKQKSKLSRGVSYVTLGKAGTGQPYITYPQFNFELDYFFGFGSPIGMFVTVRGIESLGENFKFPTCPGFLNIFHPYDPVAYRIEPLINSAFENIPPVQVPHHKGRKRMHLELKDTMAHVGAALKDRLVNSVKTTWNTFYQMAKFTKNTEETDYNPRMVLDQQLKLQAESTKQSTSHGISKIGNLNKGNRVDYVLQEAPLESFNEYLFAVGSHLCYWESEDTILLVLKELYSVLGVSPDSQVQHATMLPFDIDDGEDSSNYSTSLQFEEPPILNLSYSSLSPIFDSNREN